MPHGATLQSKSKQHIETFWNILTASVLLTTSMLTVWWDSPWPWNVPQRQIVSPRGKQNRFLDLERPWPSSLFRLRMLWRKKIGIRTRRTETEGKTKIGKEKNNKKQHHVSASSRNADMLTTQHIKLPLSDTRPQTHAVAHLPVNQHWTVLKGFQNKKDFNREHTALLRAMLDS